MTPGAAPSAAERIARRQGRARGEHANPDRARDADSTFGTPLTMAALQDPDPFADPAFLDRFSKLLPMLGSGQANEADTARRKLLEHLGHHRLTLTDVATRIRLPPQAPAPRSGNGEAELKRELDLVRHAQRASEQMARSALQQNAHLQSRATHAETAHLAALVHRRGERIAMFAATALAVGLLAIVVLDHRPGHIPSDDPPGPIQATMQPSRPPLGAQGAPASALPAMLDGERLGSVLTHDIAVRADPAPESRILGFLAHDTSVAVVRETEANGVRWVLVRSAVGAGYVPASSVALH